MARRPLPTLVVFEDENVPTLDPLHHLHAAWDIFAGTGTLADLLPFIYPKTALAYLSRPEVASVYETTPYATSRGIAPVADADRWPGAYLFINGRVLDPWALRDAIPLKGEDEVFLNDAGELVSARLTLTAPVNGDIATIRTLIHDMPVTQVSLRLASGLWDIMAFNSDRIVSDARHADLGTQVGKVANTTTLLERKRIFIGEDSSIEPGVVLDARQGPIIIADNVTVGANSVIRGPVFLDDGVVVKPLSRIGAGTSIGRTCRVGGEIGESIMLPFSNKQHDGHLGHAVVGSWCNLGAGTTNSDLKNSYGTVSVTVNGERRDTGQQFVGCLLGDHVKTGIGMMLTTGAVIGPVTSIFGVGPVPATLPPFTWYNASDQSAEPYDLEKAFTVIERVMARREQQPTAGLREALRGVSAGTYPKKCRVDNSR